MHLANLPLIDWEQAIKLAGHNRDFAKEILALLNKSLASDVSAIKKTHQEQNYAEMLKLTHKLHGAICYCGLPRLKTVIMRLEMELKNNIMDNLYSLLDQLDAETNLLLEHCSSLDI